MRMTRLITALVAVLAATILGLTATTDARAATTTTQATVAQKALPRHVVTNVRAFESRRDGIFYIKGYLRSAPGIRVYLQSHKNGGRPGYQAVTSVRSSSVSPGAFSIRFAGRCNTAYRIVVKATVRYSLFKQYVGTVTCSRR